MSVNKRLERELAKNPQTEQKRIQDIEAKRKLQREILQKAHNKIPKDVMSETDDIIRLYYMQRDDAFFSILHSTQRLQSKVTILSDYQQKIPMPNIEDRNVQITSVLQLRNPEKTAYSLEFKTFVEDQEAHKKEIKRVEQLIQDTSERIRAIVIPQILYLLLVWVPVLIQLYRYFYSENPLNEAINQTQSLLAEVNELQKGITIEKERFYSRWQKKHAEYSKLSMNPHEATKILEEYIHMEQLEQNQKNLEALIQSCDRPALQEAYQKFQIKPCYLNLFHLCTYLCEYQYSLEENKKDYSQCKQALITLGELYPTINAKLVKYSEDTMEHLKKAAVFEILETHLEKNNAASKRIEEEIEKDQWIKSIIVLGLNQKTDTDRLEIAKNRLQAFKDRIKKKQNELRKKHEFIERLKHFIQNKSGENLRDLYGFVSNQKNLAYQDYAKVLQLLYPASLANLEAEKQEMMLSVHSDAIFGLLDRYFKTILEIEQSDKPEMRPLKEVASALKVFFGTNCWTWEHFWALEQAIRKNPTYHQNTNLAALVNQITSIVANSEKFEPSREEKKPVKQDTHRQEIIVNPNNPLPTFFQPPSRNELAVNTIIIDLLEHINRYKNLCGNNDVSNEKKQEGIQEGIQSVGHQMLQYIQLLSDANTVPTISPDHLLLLQNISNFIQRIGAKDSQNQLKASDLESIKAMLEQLDSKHPIREGTQFLITVFQTKDEYIAINTQFAQIRLKNDLDKEISGQNQYEERQKGEHYNLAPLSLEQLKDMNKWRFSYLCLKLLTDYVDKLNRFASPSNEEERKLLNPLLKLATQIVGMRHKISEHSKIPEMMQTFQKQCGLLGEHPACSVADKMKEALKETEAYAKILLPTEVQLGGPKIK